MTRYSLLNDALARGQHAGGRAAASGRSRSVGPQEYRIYLGPHASDPEVCAQFRAGFALGYDTTPRARTGWGISDDVKDAANLAIAKVEKPAVATYSTPPAAPPPAPVPVKAPPQSYAPVKAGLFGLSRNASIALGVGAAAAVVGGVYFATRKPEMA